MPDRDSLTADCLLFDMDGTLIDASLLIERIWAEWANRHGVDAQTLLEASRGQRVAETIRAFAPPETDIAAEEAWLSRQAHVQTGGPVPMPGAAAILQSVPFTRWAVVTSAERVLAVKWLTAAGLAVPEVLIAAEDVSIGKPHPQGYRLAAQRLGRDVRRAVVFEDATLGVEAARAAGAEVVGIANPSLAANRNIAFWIPDFRSLHLDVDASERMTLWRPTPSA